MEKLTGAWLGGECGGESVLCGDALSGGRRQFAAGSERKTPDDEAAAGMRGQAAQMEEWKSPCRRIVSISVNVNREKTNVIMGRKLRVLWGKGWIEDSLRVLDSADFGAPGTLVADMRKVKKKSHFGFRLCLFIR